MRLKLLFFVGLLLSLQPYFSQETYAKPEDFKALKNRPLIVQTMEVKESVISTIKKKKAKAKKPEKIKKYEKMIIDYRNFVKSYNTNIKIAIEKYWKLNTEILYKTKEEVEKIKDKKSSKYAIFWYSASTTSGSGSIFNPSLSIPTLNYNRSEKGDVKIDYTFFMPYLNKKENVVTLADFILSLKLMQNHIESIEKTGKKRYTFKDYAKEEAKKNCKDLAKKDLVISATDIHKKATLSQIDLAYKNGKVIKYTDEEIIKAIENEEDVIIGFSIPFMIVDSSISRILFFKSFINVKTGKIYTCFGTVTGELNDPYFRVKEFTKYSKCK